MDLSLIEKTILATDNLVKIVITANEKITGTLCQDKYIFERVSDNKAFHTAVNGEELTSYFEKLPAPCQISVITLGKTYDFKVTKKGNLLSTSYKNDAKEKQTKYMVSESLPILEELGITRNGKVLNSMFDKFKQINHFMEIIVDSVKSLQGEISIVDFGCGKSYLTFVTADIMKALGKSVAITGIDLKADVIEKCNKLKDKYRYMNLHFITGDIQKTCPKADVVLTLHACDTATDYALINAVESSAKIILSVPCCQHQINSESRNEMKIFERYGIIKERISALYTDAIRANLLTYMGYKTQVIEFIDFDNSPKNMLIRAIKTQTEEKIKQEALTEVFQLQKAINCESEMYKQLQQKGYITDERK